MDYTELDRDLPRLEQHIGYTFRDKSLLKNALTHTSYTNEMRSKNIDHPSNERLEFLGDSVLSIEVSKYIYLHYPDLPEGDMSRVRSSTVCEKALSRFASDIHLGAFLLLGHGEETSAGRRKPSILADAFEALLAAIYLDGGAEAVTSSLLPRITAEVDEVIKCGRTKDYKTLLQQIIQQSPGDILEYVVVGESGPMNNHTFYTEARLNSNVIGRGTGRSKKDAEQHAAKEALKLFGENENA
ncbi:MAG: ribonuclease III [Ruminococcaceae bacterium]|nr:ribonuclease III [Oscillospiraceae bacterium]